MDSVDFLKHREIVFDAMDPDCDQAQTAALRLADVEGVEQVQVISTYALGVSYDLRRISLQQIEEALDEAGFHLSNKLMYKLRRALYYYTEETQRANAGCGLGDSNCTRKVFIQRYRRLEHGCRDNRPEHWRKYL
jgi:hypothetical protein